MKRRVSAAGLFVLALVALAGIGCGGTNRQDAEAIKGKPVTGGRSVTRSVAWIESHRSPETQAAVSEPGAAQPDAQPAEAEREAARLPSGQIIREKPEPEEEGGPPKSAAAQTVPLQRSGRAAIGPRSSLDEGTSFLGADSSDSGFIPPDSMGSVGPTQIVVFVNGLIRVYDKQGNVVALNNVSDADFWSPVLSPGSEPTDPGVEYDRNDQRWIISAVDTKSTNNRVMLAVSDGPEITDETDFTFYEFSESTPLGGPSRFADYPQLGVDANAVYVGVNLFTSSSGSFAGTALYVIRKTSVETPGSPVVTGFTLLSGGGGSGIDSPQPATDMDPSVADGYVIGPDNQFLGRLDIKRITDPGGTPSISANQTVTVPSTSIPLAVPAQGSTGGLDPLDDRLFEAMVARGPDGTDTLWTAHNIRVNSSGAGTSVGDRDGARWYEIGDLSSDPPTLVQSGTLFDTAATSPRFFWMPSIAMNGQGHASLNTSTAGPGRFAEVASSAHLATDPLGTTEAFDLTQSSNDTYNLGSSTPKRWGDYSQTVVDPTDDQTFWTFQEYADGTNSWGVRVIQLKAPPPATPASASPNTIPTGMSSVPVTITGASTDGSGFFDTTDPGSPFPDFDHISASVSGGVVVNSVTYTDPTHLTLDLDTTAAGTGAQSVTITNPDGQSTSCVPLVIGTDTDPPSAPNPQNTTPGSPGNSTTPLVFGSNAECGSTVKLYTDAACTDPANLAATGSAITFASPGLPVTVNPNSSTTFWATATDVANNTSACSSTSRTYIEDSIAPQVSVDSGPTSTTTETTPTFTFSATDAVGPISFQCSIDTGTASFGGCSGPGDSDTPSSPLAGGAHIFRAQGTDAAGNSAVATRSFTVQVPQPAAPDTTITKGPKKTTKRRPKFKFTASQAGSTFQCQVDKGRFASCASPFKPPKLSLGKHVLKVRAIGPTGIVDPSPAVKKFKIIA